MRLLIFLLSILLLSSCRKEEPKPDEPRTIEVKIHARTNSTAGLQRVTLEGDEHSFVRMFAEDATTEWDTILTMNCMNGCSYFLQACQRSSAFPGQDTTVVSWHMGKAGHTVTNYSDGSDSLHGECTRRLVIYGRN